ncbi:MAG: molybdate ABC transporter permease subunit [Planctomycetes bacterium]|nr:molybdate ABC transporter permease subunit [Planctomycetota bacterium]
MRPLGGGAVDPRTVRLPRAVSPVRRPLPGVLALVVALGVVFFLLPLVALCLRTPVARLGELLGSGELRDALWLSLLCSLGAASASLLLGVPLALWLARSGSRWCVPVRVLVTLPMVLPPVVAGVAMLLAFGRNGMVGAWLLQFGVALPFTTAGVVVAATYVALPFFVVTLEGGLRALDRRHEDAAATLGAGPWRVLCTVTVPMVGPSLRAGLLAAWARALGEFGATITFAGNLAGETRTLPLAVYVALEAEPDAAIVLSLVLVALSAGVLFALRRQWYPGP